MRKDAFVKLAGAAAALALAAPLTAPAAAAPPVTADAGPWREANGAVKLRLSGYLPSGVSCSDATWYRIAWGPAPDDLPLAPLSSTCSTYDQKYSVFLSPDQFWGGTTYFYRAERSEHERGEVRSVVSPALAPTVEEGWATEIEETSFTIRGAIADEGALTTWRVRWGVEGGPLDRLTPVQQLPADGGPPTELAVPLTGLAPRTHYTFRFEAENAEGRTVGPETTVGTGAAAPEVTVRPVKLTDTTVTLRATVDPNGLETELAWLTPWDQPWDFHDPTGWGGLGNGYDPVVQTGEMGSYQPDTELSFAVRARNMLGVVETLPVTVRTMPPGEVWEAPPEPPAGGGGPAPGAGGAGGGGAGGGGGGAGGSGSGGAPLVPVDGDGAVVQHPVPLAAGPAGSSRRTPVQALAASAADGLGGVPVRTLLERGATVRGLTAPAAGTLELALRPLARTAKAKGAAARPVLARGTRRFPRAGRASVRVRATRAGRSWLRGRRGAKVELTATFRPRGGGAAQRHTTAVTLGR